MIVGWVIVVAWVGSLIADVALPTYDVPLTVHGAMMLVAGYLFGPSIVGRTARDRREGDER